MRVERVVETSVAYEYTTYLCYDAMYRGSSDDDVCVLFGFQISDSSKFYVMTFCTTAVEFHIALGDYRVINYRKSVKTIRRFANRPDNRECIDSHMIFFFFTNGAHRASMYIYIHTHVRCKVSVIMLRDLASRVYTGPKGLWSTLEPTPHSKSPRLTFSRMCVCVCAMYFHMIWWYAGVNGDCRRIFEKNTLSNEILNTTIIIVRVWDDLTLPHPTYCSIKG